MSVVDVSKVVDYSNDTQKRLFFYSMTVCLMQYVKVFFSIPETELLKENFWEHTVILQNQHPNLNG